MMTPAIIETIRSELSAALPRWGMSGDATLAFLSHSENTTFLAEDPVAAQRLVLRVQRIGYHSPAEIVSELAWIEALITDEVIVTPRPRPDRDGQLLCSVPLNGTMRQVVAFEHMSGDEPDATASLPTWFLKLGALTARLHGHSRSWKRTPAFQRKAWDFAAPCWAHGRFGATGAPRWDFVIQRDSSCRGSPLRWPSASALTVSQATGSAWFMPICASQICWSMEQGSASLISTTAAFAGSSTISPRP